MSNRTIGLTATVLLGFWAIAPGWAASIPIENASFESPAMDPGGLPPLPYVEGWIEVDVDTEGSTNTGVFANTPAGSPDHLVNADGNQLAFLDSGQGNALEQDLDATYQVGRDYRLTVAVGVSGRFPPATEEPVDTLELVLYSVDANEVIDVAKETVKAPACSSSKLQDFSVSLPTIRAEDAWAGQSIGIAIRAAGMAGGFWELDNVRLVELSPRSIPIENASFEAPTVPADWLGWPLIESWLETDVDPEGQSRNTGVFPNTEPNSWDHLANAHGEQLAFLGSQEGNALEQDLDATYVPCAIYRLTVAVGISSRYPPSDKLELVLYYRDANEVVDLAVRQIEPAGFVPGYLQDHSLHSPVVRPQDAWAGQPIGVAIRATGAPGLAGGFWDLDNVRLVELLPRSIPIENASFEAPTVPPDWLGWPLIESWLETDVDPEGQSRNTGVFPNTEPNSWDHLANAHGEQLAFLGSQEGNALAQDLDATYMPGSIYQLTVAVAISSRYPPSDRLELVLYYRTADEVVDLVVRQIEPVGFVTGYLQDYSLCSPVIRPQDAWAGQPIGVAIRATGMPGLAGGFWDLDNVRLTESWPISNSAEIDEE